MSESAPAAVDQAGFRRILTRNIALPAAAGLASAIVFVGLILYLLSSMRWVDHTQEVIGNANEISRLAVDMESGMRGYLLTGDDAFLAPYRISKPKIASAMATLKQQVIDNQPQVDRLTRIAALQAQWDNFAMAAIVLRRNGGDYLKVVATGRGRQEFDEIRREFADFLDIEQRLRQERIDTSQRVTTGVILIYLLVSLGLTGLLALLGRRDLKLLATTYGEALEQHREHAAVLERQAWQRTGQSQLAQQSMGQLLLSQLGGTVLEFLATYINTSVAAVYVREDSGTLERVASYGFSREQLHTTQAFNDDESLVGQAARGRRLIHLEQVPDGYLTVNSGLGQGKPVSVLLLPLEQDDEVIGVIELGFLHRPHARVLEFLDMTAPSVAAAFKAALYRRRLQDVLQKPGNSTKSCKCSKKNYVPPTKNSNSSHACWQTRKRSWKIRRPSCSNRTISWPTRPPHWIRKMPRSVWYRWNWKRVPVICSGPASTNPNFWPTCRMSYAPRSTVH